MHRFVAILLISAACLPAAVGANPNNAHRIVVCRDAAGNVRLQDHGCRPELAEIKGRQQRHDTLSQKAEEQARQRQADKQLAATPRAKDDLVRLRVVDGGLRDDAGRKWVKVDAGFIEVMSGDLVERDRVTLDAQ